jgi:hypothetical protein
VDGLVDLLAPWLVNTVLEQTSQPGKGQILNPGPAVSTSRPRYPEFPKIFVLGHPVPD